GRLRATPRNREEARRRTAQTTGAATSSRSAVLLDLLQQFRRLFGLVAARVFLHNPGQPLGAFGSLPGTILAVVVQQLLCVAQVRRPQSSLLGLLLLDLLLFQLPQLFRQGKTHSMLALWHLFSGTPASDLPGAEEVVKETSIPVPTGVRRAVVVGTKIS